MSFYKDTNFLFRFSNKLLMNWKKLCWIFLIVYLFQKLHNAFLQKEE